MREVIELKPLKADEPLKLSILKSNYNRLVSRLNSQTAKLYSKKRIELLEEIKKQEKDIDDFTDT